MKKEDYTRRSNCESHGAPFDQFFGTGAKNRGSFSSPNTMAAPTVLNCYPYNLLFSSIRFNPLLSVDLLTTYLRPIWVETALINVRRWNLPRGLASLWSTCEKMSRQSDSATGRLLRQTRRRIDRKILFFDNRFLLPRTFQYRRTQKRKKGDTKRDVNTSDKVKKKLISII